MKYRLLMALLTAGAAALLFQNAYVKRQQAAGRAAAAASPALSKEETHQTYQLPAGARVEVSSISGPVSVEATDGQSAEVHVYRSAPNNADLAYRKVLVEQNAAGLSISQRPSGGEPSRVNLLNRVVLKLPRNASLSARGISGGVTVSGLGGSVELSGVSGSVEATRLLGPVRISGASGDVRLTAARVADGGVHISDVSGEVYLQLSDGLDADLSISNTTGGVSNKVAGLALNRVESSQYRARLGAGGPQIVVTNVTGSVVIRGI